MTAVRKPMPDSSDRPGSWHYAGLMLSYWCPARCAFCYVSGEPGQGVWADAHRVVGWWRQLETLAAREGGHVKIHLTGGEAFGNWELLVRVLDLAVEAGLPPVEKIETNAYWATDERIVEERLTKLKEFGVTLVTTDADVFHQQYVPIHNVRRLVEGAQRILGPEGVRVRWWDFYNFALENDLDIAKLDEGELREIQIDALTGNRERVTGRAAALAARLVRGERPEAFAGETCRKGIFKSKHVHIDPYGNIFPGTCCGIILGNAVSENITDVYDWLSARGASGPVIPVLAEQGPAGLIPLAERFGFRPLAGGYVSKCQLCYHLRWTIFRAGQCYKWLGPAECYPEYEW